jgi:hypothetical protein
MKDPVKPNRVLKAKRHLFVELREGMKALAQARLGKIKLRSHSVKLPHGSQEILSRSRHVTR